MPKPIIPEINFVKKNWRDVDLRVALCYPNFYRTGMTGLTIQLLYMLFNMREDVVCERFFFPTGIEPLISLESGQHLKKFDVIAFSLQYEEDYVKAIQMLIESDIPIRNVDRRPKDPILIAGGPCATENPMPMADFFDLFVIGEVEPIINQLIDYLKRFGKPKRRIEEFADIPGVYIPSIPGAEATRIWVRDLNTALHPVAQVIPLVGHNSTFMPIFGKTLTVEVVRGCGRGCRFCLICFIGRPKRERSLEKIKEIIDEGLNYTPVRKVSLLGAGISDHSRIEEICDFIVSRGLGLSIASLRVEAITERLVKMLVKGGQRTIAIAPETGTDQLRNSINKTMYEKTILEASKTALKNGIRQIKLYFMVGFPNETLEDVTAIGELTKKIAGLGYGLRGVRLSINPLVPKPHTPLQWSPFAKIEYLRSCLRLIRRSLRGDRRIRIDGTDPRNARIQAFLSLGGKKIGRTIELAAEFGGGLGAWRRALRETGVDVRTIIGGRKIAEKLPWDSIKVGLNKSFLVSEYEKVIVK